MKKKSRYTAILSLLAIVPFLMATAKTKYEVTSYYDNLSHTVEDITPEGYEYGRLYEFTLTNKGNGYISYYQHFKYKGYGNSDFSTQPIIRESVFKSNLLIMPNEQFKIRTSSTLDNPQYDLGSFSAYAYVDRDSFNYQEPLTFVEGDTYNSYYIDYQLTDLESLRDYKYYFAVTIKYDGEDYAVLCQLGDNDRIHFFVTSGFDPAKAEILKVERFHCEVYNGPNYGALAIGGMLYVMIYLFVGSFILFNLFFIPILIHRIIRKKEAQNNQNKEQ